MRLKEESGSGKYLYVDSAEGVLDLVQFNAIEFHPWAATADDPEHAQYVVFDLDPAPGVAWKRVAAAAVDVCDLLARVGLASFVRTTGGKGLHVVVPLRPAPEWAQAKDFAHAFAASLAASRPEEFVATAAKNKRDGKIFVDYLRNARGATSVASYSLRSRTGAPVAVPLAWSELGKIKGRRRVRYPQRADAAETVCAAIPGKASSPCGRVCRGSTKQGKENPAVAQDDDQSSSLRRSTPALEILHRAFVLFGCGARTERAQIPAPAGLGIGLAEYRRYSPDFNLRIMTFSQSACYAAAEISIWQRFIRHLVMTENAAECSCTPTR